MTNSPNKPPLFSDFDGTAVEKLNIKKPSHWIPNMLKYPLDMIEGYPEFMCGARDTGLAIQSVISCRPNIRLRRIATKASIRKHGLDGFFWGENAAIHLGSEFAKADYIVSRAQKGDIVSLVDDEPHKVGVGIVRSMVECVDEEYGAFVDQHVVLGAVNHNRSEEYTERFCEAVDDIEEVGIRTTERGVYVFGHRLGIEVVQLGEYSRAEGESFALGVLATRDQLVA